MAGALMLVLSTSTGHTAHCLQNPQSPRRTWCHSQLGLLSNLSVAVSQPAYFFILPYLGPCLARGWKVSIHQNACSA